MTKWHVKCSSCCPLGLDHNKHSDVEGACVFLFIVDLVMSAVPFAGMANDNDIIAHFTMQGTPPLFLCIIWKNILDESRVPSVAYK